MAPDKIYLEEGVLLGITGNWDRRLSRRTFIGLGGMSAAALVLGSKGVLSQTSGAAGYGELVPDPGGVIDLPRGFQYRMISEEGTPLSSGGLVPGDHDGMAAFPGPSSNTTMLVRNHEQRVGDPNPLIGTNPYDSAAPGGTTGILVNNEDRTEIEDFVTSSGSFNNCAGGATPWGTWLTCEEDRTTTPTQHGYVFEVDPNDPENDLSKTPILDMGFFSHEAVDIDPATGIAYLTEDDFRGSIPDDPRDEIVADVTDTEGEEGRAHEPRPARGRRRRRALRRHLRHVIRWRDAPRGRHKPRTGPDPGLRRRGRRRADGGSQTRLHLHGRERADPLHPHLRPVHRARRRSRSHPRRLRPGDGAARSTRRPHPDRWLRPLRHRRGRRLATGPRAAGPERQRLRGRLRRRRDARRRNRRRQRWPAARGRWGGRDHRLRRGLRLPGEPGVLLPLRRAPQPAHPRRRHAGRRPSPRRSGRPQAGLQRRCELRGERGDHGLPRRRRSRQPRRWRLHGHDGGPAARHPPL